MQYLLWCIRENHSIWLGLLSNGCFFSTQQWDSTQCSMWTKCFFSVDSASAIRGRTWAIKEPHYEMTWNTVMRHRYIYIKACYCNGFRSHPFTFTFSPPCNFLFLTTALHQPSFFPRHNIEPLWERRLYLFQYRRLL